MPRKNAKQEPIVTMTVMDAMASDANESYAQEQVTINKPTDTAVERANGQFANPTTHDENEDTSAPDLAFTGDYVERLQQLFEALDETSTASNDVKSAIASSLSWSLASAVARLTFAIETVQHPMNPRRIRNDIAAAEEIERLEGLRDQRAFLLSITSRMTPERLLPEPSVFTDENLSVPEARATSAELAALNGMSVKEVEARLKQGHAAARRLQMIDNKIIQSSEPIQRAMEQAVNNAYGQFTFYDQKIDPAVMSGLFNKVAEKIDLRITRNLARSEATARMRLQAELAGQNRLLTRVLGAVEDSIGEFEEDREIWQFEIANNLHRKDDRSQVEQVEAD